jgi:hypothetical protein
MTNGSSARGVVFSFVSLALAAAGAAAQEVPLVCSVTRGIECDNALECQPPLPDFPPPTFIHVDIDGGLITLLAPESRRGEQTGIGTVTRMDGNTILTGAEAGRGWSMVIAEEDLDMTLTMTDDGTGFVVFGVCLAEDETSP